METKKKNKKNNFAFKKKGSIHAGIKVKREYGVSEPQFIAEITKDFLNGYSVGEMHDKLIERYPILSDYSVGVFRESYYTNVRNNVSKELSFHHIESIFYRHLAIYENLYTYFSEIGYNEGIRKAIKGRNKLLMIVEDSITVDVEKYSPIRKDFDFTKLSKEENLRLSYYLSKVQNVSAN